MAPADRPDVKRELASIADGLAEALENVAKHARAAAGERSHSGIASMASAFGAE